MLSSRFAPWLVFFSALLWTIDAPFRKYLTGDLSSGTIVLMEHLVIAVLVLWFLSKYLSELKTLTRTEWGYVVFIGIGGSALATIAFTQSFHYVNPSVAILLQKIQPIIAILLAVIFLKEQLSAKFWLWSGLAILGAYLLSFPNFTPQLFPGESFNPNLKGVLLALLAAGLWAGSTVFGRKLLNQLSFQAMTAIRFLTAGGFLLAFQTYQGNWGEIAHATTKDWLFVLIIATIAGFISLFIYYKGLQHTKASIATLCELAFPFSAVIINWIFIPGGQLAVMQIVGGLILLGSITALSYQNSQTPPAEALNK
jgi:drug/metabolite transporter (DMT)-like permease